jgi:hypothetical protein
MKQDKQLKTIREFLNKFTNEIKNRMPSNTGNLKNSLQGNLVFIDSKFNISINAMSYATFQDQGVNGTEISYGSPYSFTSYPNVDALTPYANSKGINPYALATSLYRKGIKPKGFVSNYIDDDTEELANNVTDSVWEDFYDDNKNKKK